MLTYSSEKIYTVYEEGKSDYLLITFGFNGMRTERNSFWGQNFCRKGKINVLGIVSRNSDWFPEEYMRPAIEACLPYIAHIKNRIAYGGSMGGFGALKYGAALGAQKIMALVPQYSINPHDVGHFDTKFTEFYHADLHSNMRIKKSESASQCTWILFDPSLLIDAGHVQELSRVVENCRLVPMYHTGHATARIFKTSERAINFIELIANGDLGAVDRFVIEERRKSSLRAFFLFKRAVATHPAWAAQIAAKYGSTFASDQRAIMNKAMKSVAGRLRRFLLEEPTRIEYWKKINSCAEFALKIPVDDALTILQQAKAKANEGCRSSAIALAHKAIETSPKYAQAHHVLAAFLMEEGNYLLASNHARIAAELSPDNAQIQQRQALIEQRLGNTSEAINAISRALSLSPDDVKFRKTQAILFKNNSQFKEAAMSARKVLDLAPSDTQAHCILLRSLFSFGSHAEAYVAAEQALQYADDTPAVASLVKKLKIALIKSDVGLGENHETYHQNNS